MGILHTDAKKHSLNKTRVAANIKSARGALYALFGAGLHGRNGLTPPVTKQLWQTYVVSILIYGAELWQLSGAEAEPLERFQRKTLRALQGLPDNTANAASLGLLGILPVLTTIESRALKLLVDIFSDRTSLEYQIAVRQLALKDESSSSWFVYIQGVLHKYKLPTAHQLLESTPSWSSWKETVKRAGNQHWVQYCQHELQERSTLQHLSASSLSPGTVAVLWQSTTDSPGDAHKATIKAKVLTGTYRLQAVRARFNQHQADPTCQLCNTAPEDTIHFMLKCPVLADTRRPFLEELMTNCDVVARDRLAADTTLLLQTLLDASLSISIYVINSERNTLMARG